MSKFFSLPRRAVALIFIMAAPFPDGIDRLE